MPKLFWQRPTAADTLSVAQAVARSLGVWQKQASTLTRSLSSSGVPASLRAFRVKVKARGEAV